MQCRCFWTAGVVGGMLRGMACGATYGGLEVWPEAAALGHCPPPGELACRRESASWNCGDMSCTQRSTARE